jgi:hypothetical protein
MVQGYPPEPLYVPHGDGLLMRALADRVMNFVDGYPLIGHDVSFRSTGHSKIFIDRCSKTRIDPRIEGEYTMAFFA